MQRTILVKLLCLIIAFASANSLQAEDGPEEQNQKRLDSAMAYGYPGSMLFHTAFHQAYSTRFRLLKAAVRSKKLQEYMELTEPQLQTIKKLNPIELDPEGRMGMTDENSEPDEEVLDESFYGILLADQMKRLDILGFYFDGYAALTRKSVANGVQLSGASREKVLKIVREKRDEIFMPQFRMNFAGTQKPDHNFRQTYFNGRYVTLVHTRILMALSREEIDRIQKWLESESAKAVAAADAVLEIAPLPAGLDELLPAPA